MDINNPFESKKDKRYQESKKNFIIAIVALFLVALLSFVAILAKNGFDMKVALGGEADSTTEGNTEITEEIAETENYYLFWISNEDDSDLKAIWLAKLEMPSAKLVVYSPSTQDMLKNEGQFYTMSNYYSIYGAKAFVDKLAETYEIEIPYYIGSTEGMFRQMINYLGGVELDVKKQINYSGEFNLVLTKGINHIKGELLYRYILFAEKSEDYELTDRSEVLIDIYNSMFSQDNESKLSSVFSKLANNTTTNISIVTYQEKSDELSYLYANGIFKSQVADDVDSLKKG